MSDDPKPLTEEEIEEARRCSGGRPSPPTWTLVRRLLATLDAERARVEELTTAADALRSEADMLQAAIRRRPFAARVRGLLRHLDAAADRYDDARALDTTRDTGGER